MTTSATATQLTLTNESLIAQVTLKGATTQVLDFTAYNDSLSDINDTLTMSIDNTSYINEYLAYLWSSGETTQSIDVIPSEAGSLTRTVTIDDGVTTDEASASVSIFTIHKSNKLISSIRQTLFKNVIQSIIK